LGAEPIRREQLLERADTLASWSLESIELYACHAGADAAFVQALEQLSGAKVAASSGVVGHTSLGGSWALQGRVSNAIAPFSRSAMNQWAVALAVSTPDLTAASDDGTSSTDNMTTITTPTFTGTAPKNTALELVSVNGFSTIIGSGTSNASGNYSIQVSSPLAAGQYSIKARYNSTDYYMGRVGNGGADIPNQAIQITPADTLYSPQKPFVGYYLDLGSVASLGTSNTATYNQLSAAYATAKVTKSTWGTFAGDAFEITITGQSYGGNNVTYIVLESVQSQSGSFSSLDYVQALLSDPNGSPNGSFISTVNKGSTQGNPFTGPISSTSSLSLTIASGVGA
jgi:hypothetical protein